MHAGAPVSVLQVHGTADTEVLYGGGAGVPLDGGTVGGASYPGATTTVADSASLDGCATTPDTSQPALDIDALPESAETTVTQYAAGCRAGT